MNGITSGLPTLSYSSIESLPQPGTPAFERAIRKSHELAKKRQPAVEERVSPEVEEERRLADAFLSTHNRMLRHIAGRAV